MELIQYIKETVKISCSMDVYNYLEEFRNQDREHFIVLGLNAKNNVLYRDIVCIGILDGCMVHPREIFKSACMKSAHKIIIAHNHPSGDSTPSSEDIILTKNIKECGEILGINLVDSIIIGKDNYHSLIEGGNI